MNRVVSSILRNRKNDADDGLSKKRRQRLTNEQQMVLEQEYQKKADWSSPGALKDLSRRLGLPKSKIYKWNWDRKRKEINSQAALSQVSNSNISPFLITLEQRRIYLEEDEEESDSEQNSIDEVSKEEDSESSNESVE